MPHQTLSDEARARRGAWKGEPRVQVHVLLLLAEERGTVLTHMRGLDTAQMLYLILRQAGVLDLVHIVCSLCIAGAPVTVGGSPEEPQRSRA